MADCQAHGCSFVNYRGAEAHNASAMTNSAAPTSPAHLHEKRIHTTTTSSCTLQGLPLVHQTSNDACDLGLRACWRIISFPERECEMLSSNYCNDQGAQRSDAPAVRSFLELGRKHRSLTQGMGAFEACCFSVLFLKIVCNTEKPFTVALRHTAATVSSSTGL